MTITEKKIIRYETQDLEQELRTILTNLLQQVDTDSINQVLGNQLSSKFFTSLNEIFTRLQGNFSLAVVGDFKRGKSTLINALVGSEVVTTNVTPETVTINYIEHGTENKIEAVLEDGGKVDLTSEELYAAKLEPILKQLPPLKHLKIQTPIKWLQGISLIDTPGTGDIFQRFDLDVHSILERADAVIFTISTLSPLSLSEQNFLRVSLSPQDFPKVFFVVNMLDLARTELEATKLLDSIKAKINRLFPQAQVFGISAKDEFCRLQDLPRPNPQRAENLEADFAQFRESIGDSILLNRDVIHLSRIANQIDRDLDYWKSQVLLLRNGMQSSQIELGQAIALCEDKSSQLYAQIEQHKQEMTAEIEQLALEIQGWLNSFLDRFEVETIESLTQYQFEAVRRHYPFFFVDSLHKAVAACLDIHAPKILESLDRASTNILQHLQLLSQNSSNKSELVQYSLAEQKWSNLDTLQAIANFTPFNVITEILLDSLKKSDGNTKVLDYQQQIKNYFPQLRTSILEQTKTIYQQITRQLETEIETLYQSEIESSLSALQQAQDLSHQEEKQVTQTNQSLGQILALLTQSHNQLKNWQQKLWNEN
jgi:Dynamin family